MIIVLDLSEKLDAYHLYKNFFYELEKDGELAFAINPLKVDDEGYNYDKIAQTVKSILFKNKVNKWSLCVLYNMAEQEKNPIKCSMSGNVYDLKKHIIDPIKKDYSFEKLYYLSLDEVERDINDEIVNDDILLSVDIDSVGYTRKTHQSNFSEAVFSEDDLYELNLFWEEFLEKNKTDNGIIKTDVRTATNEVLKEFKKLHEKITNAANNLDCGKWYTECLKKVKVLFESEWKKAVNSYSSDLGHCAKPSVFLENVLKSELSSYKDDFAVMLRIDIRNKSDKYAKNTMTYRRQIEIASLLVFLATNKNKKLFESGSATENETHWCATVNLNDKVMIEMFNNALGSFENAKKKIDDLDLKEIIYQDYAPPTLDLGNECIKKYKTPTPPVIKIFADDSETEAIERYSVELNKLYEQSVKASNIKIHTMTANLRQQIKDDSVGVEKKGKIEDVRIKLSEFKNEINKLEKNIVNFCSADRNQVDPEIKRMSNEKIEEIRKEMEKRVNKSTFIKLIFLFTGLSACVYPLMQITGNPSWTTLYISLGVIVVPTVIYAICQIACSVLQQKRIYKLEESLKIITTTAIRKLQNDEKNPAKYITDMYNLIMYKDYARRCETAISEEEKRSRFSTIHSQHLNEHIQKTTRLMKLLDISQSNLTMKGKEIDLSKTFEDNYEVYCPLCYLKYIDNAKNTICVNDNTQENTVTAVRYVDKFEISYDKEYRHD